MRVRHLAKTPKVQIADTGWRIDDMPPRACPIYSKSRPTRAGWQWRSAKAEADGQEFTLVALANISRGDLKAILITKTGSGHSVVSRYEFHTSHPGLHAHAHCGRSGIEDGATGMDGLARIPRLGARHNRVAALSLSTFWVEARRFFRIHDDLGPLFKL